MSSVLPTSAAATPLSSPRLATPAVAPPVVPNDQVSVLMVDDRPENLYALEAILEPLDLRLVRAMSGDEALKQILKNDYAVILLDVQMPGLNGFDTAKIIKSRERSKAIPIIFLTAISKDEEYVFKGYEVGAVDYMFKPFNPDVLRSKVSVFVDLYRKQEQLRRQEQQLRENERRELELHHREEMVASQARFSEIVGSALDAIITFDADQRITLFNAAAERMFCYEAKDVLTHPLGELFPEPFRPDYLQAICSCGPQAQVDDACVSETGEPMSRTMEFVGMRDGGERFPLEASISCLDIGGTKLYTLIGRDVSERQAAEEALRNTSAQLRTVNEELTTRQAQLEEAMRARNRFYASMSHELRTPINAVIGYTTLMIDNIYGALNEKQLHGLQRTHKAAKHLLELVNDVLDLSKIEAGKIELALQPVAFPGLIEDLFVTVRPLADEHGSVLTLEHEGEPQSIVTDPRRVRQIMLNLLSNAIKFGAGKPITVSVLPHDGGIAIAVRDEGQGIAPEDLARIFEEFVQLSQNQQLGGTGLGLPISQRLAQLLGAELEAESTVGAGSVFRLTLPRAADVRTGNVPLIPGTEVPAPIASATPLAPLPAANGAPPAAAGAATSSGDPAASTPAVPG